MSETVTSREADASGMNVAIRGVGQRAGVRAIVNGEDGDLKIMYGGGEKETIDADDFDGFAVTE